MPLKRIYKNSVFNFAGTAVPLLVGAATLPFLLQKLGVEKFGILTILWAIIGYFSLFDLGLGRAITMKVSDLVSQQKRSEASKVIRIGLEFTLLIGVVGGFALYFAAPFLAQKVLNVTPGLELDVENSLRLAALGMPLATVTSGLRGVLEGYEEFYSSNIAKVSLGVLLFALPLIGIYAVDGDLVTLSGSLVAARFISTTMYFIFSLEKLKMAFLETSRDSTYVGELFSISSWMTISSVISPLLVSADRFIISHKLGADHIAYYTVPMEFLTRILIIPASIGTALLPAMAKGRLIDIEIQEIYRRSSLTNFFLLGATSLLSAAASYPTLLFFFNKDFAAKSIFVCIVLCVGIFINGLAYMPYTALHAKGITKPVAIAHTAELFIYFPALFLLLSTFGINGAAIAWLLRVSVDYLALNFLYKKSKLS